MFVVVVVVTRNVRTTAVRHVKKPHRKQVSNQGGKQTLGRKQALGTRSPLATNETYHLLSLSSLSLNFV